MVTSLLVRDGGFMMLYFISSQFYSDSMNIKCNKNEIYSRREFCIGVQEDGIYLPNSPVSFISNCIYRTMQRLLLKKKFSLYSTSI